MPLRVLHFNTEDIDGGAARDALRLHRSLRDAGHDSRMLVVWKRGADPSVRRLFPSPALWNLDRAARSALKSASIPDMVSPSALLLLHDPWVREADVVQLHNLHGGAFPALLLPALARRVPVVWRLADMWAFTGHCGFSFDCQRWRTGCGECPILADYPPLRVDTTALLWAWKRSAYRNLEMTVVAPSRWMASQARASPLLGRFPVHVIPNGIDLETFRPLGRAKSREMLGLPQDGAVLLFSAHWVSDRRKGAAFLAEALRRLPGLGVRNLTLMVAGNGQPPWLGELPFPVHHLGMVRDDAAMAAAYCAADAFALPTLADNLPNGVLESMACGTTVVAFAAGGVPELVRHHETGWLAPPGDIKGLATGLAHVLGDPAASLAMGRRARLVAERDHAASTEASRFEALYRQATGDALPRLVGKHVAQDRERGQVW